MRVRARGADVPRWGSGRSRRDRDDARPRRGQSGRRGVCPRLVWPRVRTRPHCAGRRRAGCGRCGRRRRRGDSHGGGGRVAGRGRAAADATQGLPAARALLGRPRRRRGRRPAQRGTALPGRQAAGGRGDLRPLRLARGEARHRVSPPGRRAWTGSSSSAPSIRAAHSCSSTSASPGSGPAPAGR